MNGPPAASEARQLMAAVARMYYLDDLDQRRIAAIVGVSRSKVSRLLTAARASGVVRIEVVEHDPRDRVLEEQLVARFGLRAAVVARAAGRPRESVRRTVGHVAAPFAAGLIRSGMVVGVAGGRTLREVVGAIRPVDGVAGVSVVQLMGSIGPSPGEIDAVELSRLMAQRLGGALYALSAPAIAGDRATRDVFLSHEQIRPVWRMLDALEVAFVGIGSPDDSAFVERGVLDDATLGGLRAAGAVGEICGRFFDADGRECATGYRERVISVGLDALRRTPEVVGVTQGRGRAAAARAAIAGQLVDSLVVDDRCAEALLEER